ncbi:hypothetical protein Pfo_005406 [Paulownia fortunei]|nr:hypothetical protein Pfo_005406 [Paulownia fortunei]
MSIALSAKNKIGFIDGSIKNPSASNDKFVGWKRCNDMVLSWILNSIDPSLSNSVIYTELASVVWADLNECFFQNNALRIFQLQRDIASLHQETMSVIAYYSKLKSLWDEFSSYNDLYVCVCEAQSRVAERDELKKVMQFLMGLNDTYSAIHGQILLTKLHCTHCNGTNHTVERCYHLHEFSSTHKKKLDQGRANKAERSLTNNVQIEGPIFTQEQYQKLLNLLNNNYVSGMVSLRQILQVRLGNEEDDWFGEAT